jgi:H+-translocating NAD(P) transhydrogenase subunit beta
MLPIIPELTVGATYVVAAFLVMSGLSMLVVVSVSFLYVFSVNGEDQPSFAVETGLAVCTTVARTSMLQMVALYNGIGGGAAGAIAAVVLFADTSHGATQLVVALTGALIGAVSLSGSLIAWARLDGVIGKPLRVRGQQVFNATLIAAVLALSGYIVLTAQAGADGLSAAPWLIYSLFACALIVGVLMTLPIRMAHVPVVISIYNGVTGLAVGLEGFVLRNPTLLLAGIAVGAARMLLTLQMAKR